MRKITFITFVATLALLLAGSAFAQGIPTGLTIVPSAIDGEDVDLDLTLNTSFPFYYANSTVGRLGTQFYTQTYQGYFGLATMLNPVVNAVDFGDGMSTVGATTIPLATAGSPPGTPNVFRGSMSHTYPGDGDYVATVGKASFLGPVGSTFYPPTTGNLVTQNTLSFSQYSSFYGTTVNFTTVLTFPFALGLTNTVPVAIASAVPIEIPTLPQGGLLLLAALLAAAGAAVLLRR